MGRDQDREAAQFEWVNAWAALNKAEAASTEAAKAALTAPAPVSAPVPVDLTPAVTVQVTRPPQPSPGDQLMRDIAEIERARDALAAVPVSRPFSKGRTQALTLVPARTTDSVPVAIGGVLALVMLTVFGAAAAMGKLTR